MPKPQAKIQSEIKELKSFPKQKPSDFSNEYIDKKVRVKLADGSLVEGILLESSKYWLKIRSDKLLYINKAWVIMVEPLERG